LREVQKLAPSYDGGRGNHRENAALAKTTQLLREIGEDMRHIDMELICDAQMFKTQLDHEFRKHADRIFVGQGQYGDTVAALGTREANAGEIARKVTSYDTGQFAITGHDGYTLPVEMTPPRSNHLETTEEANGFVVRVDAHDHEELRSPDWNTDVPDELLFDVEDIPIGDEDGDEVEQDFIDDCLVKERGEYVFLEDLYNAYRMYAFEEDGEAVDKQTLMRDYVRPILGIDDGDKTQRRRDGRRATAYNDVSLSARGRGLADRF